jgi:hypothetical protein
MLSGRKSANVPEDRDAGAAPVWRSVAIAAILAGLGLAMARVTTIPERPASTSHMASPGEAGAG